MANSIIYSERLDYVKLELKVACPFLSLAIIGIAVIFSLYCRFCRTRKAKKNEQVTSHEISPQQNRSRIRKFSNFCKKHFSSLKHLHRILSTVFSSISELYIERENHPDVENPVLIVSERKSPIGYFEWSTYFYFTYMLLMCCLWFIATAVELSIYRKTGTCNDINVKVQSFSCFDVGNDYAKIDCKNTSDIDTRHVICYLYSPNIAGFGVAYSAAKLISVLADTAFTTVLKLTYLTGAELAGFLRILSLVSALVCLSLFLWATQTERLEEDYFTYGGIPMRATQLLLLCLTVAGVILLPPWIKYPNNEYNIKYRHLGYIDVENVDQTQDTQSQSKS